jgi:hypothetical protein
VSCVGDYNPSIFVVFIPWSFSGPSFGKVVELKCFGATVNKTFCLSSISRFYLVHDKHCVHNRNLSFKNSFDIQLLKKESVSVYLLVNARHTHTVEYDISQSDTSTGTSFVSTAQFRKAAMNVFA